MPYGALKLLCARTARADFVVAETPMPYGALKLYADPVQSGYLRGGGNANALRGTETRPALPARFARAARGGNANVLRCQCSINVKHQQPCSGNAFRGTKTCARTYKTQYSIERAHHLIFFPAHILISKTTPVTRLLFEKLITHGR